MALVIFAAAPTAFASTGTIDKIKSGTCGGRPWTLQLKHDNGKIEAEYELHHLRIGSTWRVVMKDNGNRFFRGLRVAGSDHSIRVDKHTANRAGTDRITVRARNLASGVVCTAAARIS